MNLRSTLILAAAAALTPLTLAEPVTFDNSGAILTWNPGGNFGPPYPDPCDPATPFAAFRGLDLTRPATQYAPTSPYPAAPSAICYQGPMSGSNSGDPQSRSIRLAGGSSVSGIATGGAYFAPNVTIPTAFRLLAPFAPGMSVGPSSAFANVINHAANPPTGFFHRFETWFWSTRQYIGLKFELPDGTHYGWMLLDRSQVRPVSNDPITPVAWGYETTPNTPAVITSTLAASPFIPATTNSVAIWPSNSAPRYLAGPAIGPFPASFTDADFAAARAGPSAFAIPNHSDWFRDGLGTTWFTTSTDGSADRTALFAFDFTLPADFSRENSAVDFTLDIAVADRLGPEGSAIPGIYLNGVGLPNTSGIGVPSDRTRFAFPRVETLLRRGVNTLYLYNVNYASSAPYASGAGILPYAWFSLSTHPRLSTSASISPASATIVGGSSLQLYGGVLSPESTAVTWSATGGTVSPTGLFTAPAAAGVYAVTVTSLARPSISASASITVTAPPCPADFNHDNVLDPDDLSDYIACFFAVPPCQGADFNHDNVTDPDDLSDYIGAFFSGC